MKKLKNNPEKNKMRVNLINRLRDLKEELENMSEEKEVKNPNEIMGIVKTILEFHRQQQGQG